MTRIITSVVGILILGANAWASSPVFKGGTVASLDQGKRTMVVENGVCLGYDYQGKAITPSRQTIRFIPQTLVLIDGKPVTHDAIKPGMLLKRAFVKGGGFIELFSADSPMLDSDQACMNIALYTGRLGQHCVLRIERTDGKTTRAFAVVQGGGRPGMLNPSQAIDASDLTFVDGKLTGTVKIAGKTPWEVTLDAVMGHGVVRGSFTGTVAGKEVTGGTVNGELDYPQDPEDGPTAYAVLGPGWDGGKPSVGPLLMAMRCDADGKLTDVLLKVYGRESTAVIEASDLAGTVLPKVAGRFKIKIQDGDATRVRVVDLNRNTGSMGLGGAVGTAFLCQPVGIAAEGGKPRRINGGILVLNGRAYMNEGGK